MRLINKRPVMQHYMGVFWELLRTPFQHIEMIWGIVPLYFGWALNELTSDKASYRTAIQTGFSFIWAGANWAYTLGLFQPGKAKPPTWDALIAVNVLVTLLIVAVGFVALISGVRKKYPKGATFLGQSRFANYFMIAIFPIQAGFLRWSWERLGVIVGFGVPLWVLLHLALKPLRNR